MLIGRKRRKNTNPDLSQRKDTGKRESTDLLKRKDTNTIKEIGKEKEITKSKNGPRYRFWRWEKYTRERFRK